MGPSIASCGMCVLILSTPYSAYMFVISSKPVVFEFVKLTLTVFLKLKPLISTGANGEPCADPFNPLIPEMIGES